MLTSTIELDQKALQNNIAILKEQFKDSRISSVVKANAYGHGLREFIAMAGKCGIDHFSVFSSGEAKKVHAYLSFPADIMVMGWVHENDFEWIVSNKIDVCVFDLERFNKLIEYSRKTGIAARIHIDLETGMNRTGFAKSDVGKLIQIMLENKQYYEFRGLCTHFAGAESIANYKRIKEQIHVFNRIYKQFGKHNLIPEIRHTACSAAAISYPDTRFEMVRVGIIQYGLWPSKETLIQFLTKNKMHTDPFKQVLKWKSVVMAVKSVKTGEFVSYGTSYLAQRDMKIAIVPVGYAHGYSRSLSNQGRVIVNGKRVGVIGMVNMNMLIIDVTSVDSIKIGDEVVLIGKQGDLSITVASFSEISDQLNYELLTHLSNEIPRVIVN